MGQQPEILEASQVEAITTLRLLDNIERTGVVSQRSLAGRLGGQAECRMAPATLLSEH